MLAKAPQGSGFDRYSPISRLFCADKPAAPTVQGPRRTPSREGSRALCPGSHTVKISVSKLCCARNSTGLMKVEVDWVLKF